jgi:glycosyltransferase involved in cell wall biosynthesis
MKILLVTDNRFWRNELGSHRRISSLCEHLNHRGHDVHILFTGYLYPEDVAHMSDGNLPYALETLGTKPQPAETGEQLSATANALSIAKRFTKQLLLDAKRLAQQHWLDTAMRHFALRLNELKLADFHDPHLLARFRATCHAFQPQVLVIEYARLAFLLDAGIDAIPQGCLTVIDTHDVQHERQIRFHALGQVHDIDITAAEEAAALAMADVAIAIQATDAAKFRQLLPAQRVIVAGYPSECFKPAISKSRGEPVRIGFFGSFMLPNLNAAQALITRYFPSLRSSFGSNIELHLFGRVCEAPELKTPIPGIHLHGFVGDLNAAYSSLDVIANPVSFGGGLKIKNVEALCHGLPLVTTPIGAEGIESGAGHAFLVADGEAEFARVLSQVVADEHLREALGNAAYTFAKAELGEDAVYAELDSTLEQHARGHAMC